MSDRSYRFILGLSIIISLFLELHFVIYFIIGIMSLEFITNYRLPILINRLRKSSNNTASNEIYCPYAGFEAERVFRLIVIIFISLGSVVYIDTLWFLPWFVGLNLILAGITGICPLVMLLHKLGLK